MIQLGAELLTKVKRDEPPQKISKLAIAADTEADLYETKTQVRCYECNVDDVPVTNEKLRSVIDGVLEANTFATQAEVQAWEQEMTACEHTLCLIQEEPRHIDSQGILL
jgi:ubiquitin carboxyl-terminal hydrolase 5/13